MSLTAWLPVVTVILAVIGGVVAMLKFPQERASAVIAQQSTVLADMKSLNDDLGNTANRIRGERDELLAKVTELTTEIRDLRREISGGPNDQA